jgi:D-alanine-D-alanine ligase
VRLDRLRYVVMLRVLGFRWSVGVNVLDAIAPRSESGVWIVKKGETLARLRVAVLFGGRSGEHSVSLVSAASVLAALNPATIEVVQIGIDRHGRWFTGPKTLDALNDGNFQREGVEPALFSATPGEGLKAGGRTIGFDVALPVIHGTNGEDGTLQGLMELAGVAYAASGVVGSAVCMDKSIFKAVAIANGLPTLPYVDVPRHRWHAEPKAVLDQIEEKLRYPVFAKPCNMGSSVGVVKAQNRLELQAALEEAARWDRRLVVEQGVDAREIEVAILGNASPKASVAGEIVPDRDFYDFESKYADSDSRLHIPAPLPPEQSDEIRAMALHAFAAMDCAGLARVDFLMEKESGAVWLNEINTMPGFTSISMYPKLWDASGLPYSELLDEVVRLAVDRKQIRDSIETTFEGVVG